VRFSLASDVCTCENARARPCACARTRSHAFLNDEKTEKCWLSLIKKGKNEQKAKAYFVRF
jgi:hypothetical protein